MAQGEAFGTSSAKGLAQHAKISLLRTFNGRCVHGVAPPTYATTRTAKEHFLVVPVVVYNLL